MTAPATDNVAVVIVNHDAGEFLARSLACLAHQTLLPARIVVFDNASSDGSLAAARDVVARDARLAPRTVFEESGVNLGFAAANNRAVETCDTEFVALLNPDAFPEPGWLAALLDAARRYPAAAAFGSRQLRAAFLEAGGFDEDFFCYFEDVDLGFRLRLAGHEAVFVSEAVVLHVGGGSSGTGRNDFAVFHGHRNLVWCFVKNMPSQLFWPLLLAHFSQSILTAAVSVTRGEFQTIVKAKWHAVLGLPSCWRKRHTVQSRRRASVATIWRSLDASLWRRRCRPGPRPSIPR